MRRKFLFFSFISLNQILYRSCMTSWVAFCADCMCTYTRYAAFELDMLFIGDLQLISIHMQASINTKIMFRPQKHGINLPWTTSRCCGWGARSIEKNVRIGHSVREVDGHAVGWDGIFASTIGLQMELGMGRTTNVRQIAPTKRI